MRISIKHCSVYPTIYQLRFIQAQLYGTGQRLPTMVDSLRIVVEADFAVRRHSAAFSVNLITYNVGTVINSPR